LSAMYIGVCVLKKFKEDGSKSEDELLLKYIMQDLFTKIQVSFDGLFENLFENCFVRILIYPIKIFSRFNRFDSPINDKLTHKIAKLSLDDVGYRDSLTEGIYIPKDKKEALGRLENALDLFRKSTSSIDKINNNIKLGNLPKDNVLNLIDEALSKKLIDKEDVNIIRAAHEAINDAVQVDDYTLEEYKNI
jgi:acyl-CoA dehydrogenase